MGTTNNNNNKRRLRPQSQAAGVDADADAADDDLNPKEKARRVLPSSWLREEVLAVLPRELTEYTAEDAARFDRDMALTDKMLDESDARIASFHPVTSRRPIPTGSYISRGILHDKQQEQKEQEDVTMVGDGGLMVSKANIKMLRSFAARSGYYPVSERFLRDRSLITEAAADECRKSDRLISKLYAWTQEGVREVVRQYDAATTTNGTSTGTGTGNASPAPPADH